MNEAVNTIGLSLPMDESLSSGIGYIALPSDISREKYLLDCYQNTRVSLHTAHDGFLNRVNISEEDLNWIEFPEDYKSFGTTVYYITDPTNGEKYIVKRFNKKSKLGTGRENAFDFGRTFKDSVVQINGNPQQGYLNIIVSNDDEASLNINVIHKDDKGELNLNVKGNMNVVATGDVDFNSNGNYTTRVSDPETKGAETQLTQTINSIKATTPSFNINNGKENFVLGQKFKKFFEEFITEVAKSTTPTMFGTMPLNNAAQIAAFRDKIDDFLSEVGYIDR